MIEGNIANLEEWRRKRQETKERQAENEAVFREANGKGEDAHLPIQKEKEKDMAPVEAYEAAKSIVARFPSERELSDYIEDHRYRNLSPKDRALPIPLKTIQEDLSNARSDIDENVKTKHVHGIIQGFWRGEYHDPTTALACAEEYVRRLTPEKGEETAA